MFVCFFSAKITGCEQLILNMSRSGLLFSTSEVLDAVAESALLPLMLQVKLDLPFGRFLNSRRQMLPGKMRALALFLKGACCSSSGLVVSRSLSPCVYLQNTSKPRIPHTNFLCEEKRKKFFSANNLLKVFKTKPHAK